MSLIADSQPLKFTCGVCGTPVLPLIAGVPGLPGAGASTCKVCNKKICGKHYKRSAKVCVQCAEGKSSWCKTPGPIPDIPLP